MDRSAAEVWAATLAQLPGTFERLIYLGGLRNTSTGEYEHHGLATRFGRTDANAAILASHEAAFVAWLSKSVDEQVSDVELYLSRNELDDASAVQHWVEVSPCAYMIPASARDSERELCSNDFEAVLEVFKRRLQVRRRDPEDR